MVANAVNNPCPKQQITASNRRIPEPAEGGWYCLVLAGPRRRRVTEETQQTARTGAELEAPTGGYGKGVSGANLDGAYRIRTGVRRTPPYPPFAFQHVPNLLNSPVPHRPGHPSCRQAHLNQTGPSCLMTPVHQQPNIGAVWGRGVWGLRAAAHRWWLDSLS